jgi:hypothetical protein
MRNYQEAAMKIMNNKAMIRYQEQQYILNKTNKQLIHLLLKKSQMNKKYLFLMDPSSMITKSIFLKSKK